MSPQRLTSLEGLSLNPRQRIERRCEKQKDGRHKERGALAARDNKRHPLDDAHDGVDEGAHVIGFEFADEGVEFGGGGADAEEEGDFDEDDYEGGDAGYRC